MDDLISDFLAETKEGLDNLDNQLVTLEQNPNNKELLSSIFRIMHTIKGTCGFLALSKLESIAHAGENIMDKIRSNQLTIDDHIISLILECVDKIKEIITIIEATGKEPEEQNIELIQKLNDAANGKTVTNISQIIQSNNFPITSDNNLDQNKSISLEKPIDPLIKTEQIKDNSQTNNHYVDNNHTIRVSIDVLENLMQVVGELVLNRNQLLQLDRNNASNQFSNSIQTLNHITSQLQEGIMKTRMQPISNAWAKLPRMIRDISKEMGKKVNLNMIGEETELDRQLIESIKDPLVHMIRNSVDHGLETPEERISQGKHDVGTINLKAFHQGGHIIIEISDDGRGINTDLVKKKIISNNLATIEQVEKMTESQIIQYIFNAGFSTASTITSVSGRGVGMDVVKNNINKINGIIDLKSIPGKGTFFTIKIPLTLAIMPILIVEVNGEHLAIPQINVLEVCKIGQNEENKIEQINESKLLRIRNKLLPLVDLKKLFSTSINHPTTSYVVVCEMSGNSFGIIVDKVLDSEEIVVKPIVESLMKIGLYSGNTILGNGKVIMILDPVGLFKTISMTENYKENNDYDYNKTKNQTENSTTFLVVKVDKKTYKAIPLEIVSRIEEITPNSIEISNGHEVIQYRGTLMPLIKISDELNYNEQEHLQVVVFNNNNTILGIIVKEIVDAVIIEMNNDSNFFSHKAVIINEKAMDIIDVGELFQTTNHLSESAIIDESIINQDEIAISNEIIIYIDDSVFFRKLIPPSLKHLEKEIITFDSALNAIEYMQQNNTIIIKAIITDINMPKMSGIEFAQFCKNHPKFNNIPIIALTSINEESRIQDALNYGILYCIAKTNHHEIVKHLSKIISSEKAVS